MPEINISNKTPVTATAGASKSVSTKDPLLEKYCKRPEGLTEVRRDGKDTDAVVKVIKEEYNKSRLEIKDHKQLESHMLVYVNASWATMESLHEQMLEDNTPANEIEGLDQDHWYEINLTNASLFSNLNLKGMKQLVSGRLFTTRMPVQIIGVRGGLTTSPARNAFLKKCKQHKLKVICVLAEPHEFEKYSGRDDLPNFYRTDCKLTMYNPSFEDFKCPEKAYDLLKAINDVTYHLSRGENCLVHCAGGTGRTGMVVAAILQNLGVYDAVGRIRRIKSSYVEKKEQEDFLKDLPRAIDMRIIEEKPELARGIAADHLIQVIRTHGSEPKEADKGSLEEDKGNLEEKLTVSEIKDLGVRFGKVFDLIDLNKSGTLENSELKEWLPMCGTYEAKIKNILGGKKCTKAKFVEQMFLSVDQYPREY